MHFLVGGLDRSTLFMTSCSIKVVASKSQMLLSGVRFCGWEILAEHYTDVPPTVIPFIFKVG